MSKGGTSHGVEKTSLNLATWGPRCASGMSPKYLFRSSMRIQSASIRAAPSCRASASWTCSTAWWSSGVPSTGMSAGLAASSNAGLGWSASMWKVLTVTYGSTRVAGGNAPHVESGQVALWSGVTSFSGSSPLYMKTVKWESCGSPISRTSSLSVFSPGTRQWLIWLALVSVVVCGLAV